MSKTIIGIDPGKSGGIAVIFPNGEMECYSMPETHSDIARLFEEMSNYDNVCAYIELVHSMSGQGVKSVFTFGENFGFLQACLHCNYIPFEKVTPQKWQKDLGITKSETKTKHKNKLKGLAQQFYPKAKITLKTADAILIAYYGRKNCVL